jgi:hypothetical protein
MSLLLNYNSENGYVGFCNISGAKYFNFPPNNYVIPAPLPFIKFESNTLNEELLESKNTSVVQMST